MKVKDWLPEFIDRHHHRHPRDDWPHPGHEPYWRLWLDTLLSLDPRPKLVEAEMASHEIRGDALDFPQDHPAAVAFAIRAARQPRPTLKVHEPPPPAIDPQAQRDEFAASEYRTSDGHFDWRAMVAAIAARGELS